MKRKEEYAEAPAFGRRRKFQDMSELETRVAAAGFRQGYNKPPIQGLTRTGRFPSDPNWQDIPNPLKEIFAKVLDIKRRERILKALMEAGMGALRQHESEARVWLDSEVDLGIARQGLRIMGQTILLFLWNEEKSTPDCLEMTNGSCIVLKLKES